MKINKDVQMWIVMAVLLGALLYSFLYFFYIPLGNKVKSSAAELADKQKKLESARQVAQRYEQAKFQEAQLSKTQDYLDSRLGNNITFPYLVEEMSKLFAASRITSSELKTPQKVLNRSVDGVEYTALYTEITFQTNYHEFCNFLSRLSGLTRPFSAFILDMKYVPGNPGKDLQVSAALLAYQMKK